MDRTGKSTIGNTLSKLLNCKLTHFDKPKNLEDGKKQYFGFLKTVEPYKNIICDRFHDGEHIYAPIYRGYESDYLPEFETELKKHPYLFVNTIASLPVIIERIKTDGEDFVQEEHYKTILESFERFIEKQSMPYIKVNTDNSDINQYMIEILVAMDKVQKLHDFSVNNNCKNVYYGNIYANNFVIVKNTGNLKEVKLQLLKMGIYHDSWITTTENNEFVEYQLQLFGMKKVYTL